MPRWTAWVRRAAPSLSKVRAQCVLTVFSETKSCVAISRLLSPRAIRVEDFELACRDAQGLLTGRIRSEGGGGFRGDKHFLHHDRFAGDFATARDAEAEPDAKGREEDGDERAVELDRVLNYDEAVFSVLQDGDEEAADQTEDEDVALHDGV